MRNDFDDDYRYNTDDRYIDYSQNSYDNSYGQPYAQWGNNPYQPQNNTYNRYNVYTAASEMPSSKLEQLRMHHPDARIATAKDGVTKMLGFGITGLIFVIIGLSAFLLSVNEGEVTKDFFAHAESVSGTVLSCESRRAGRRHRTTVYDVTYVYQYNGIEYTGKQTLSSSTAKKMDVRGMSAVGNPITVYYDRRDPSSSRIYKSNGDPEYFILIFVITGVAVIIWGVKMYHDCKNGKIAIYRKGRKTVITKIR